MALYTVHFGHSRRNEELDDKVVIRKLKQRVAELEAEIITLKDQSQLSVTPQHSSLTSPAPSERSGSFIRPLSDGERQRCHEILHAFFHGKIDNPVNAGELTTCIVLLYYRVAIYAPIN